MTEVIYPGYIEPAHDMTWAVGYEWLDGDKEPETESMVVSALTIEDARREARYSLDQADTPYNIVSIERT